MRLTEIGDPLDVPVVTLTGTTTVLQRYAYDAIGNIASTTGAGTYAYAETGYANPHAATSINGTNLSYDNNGNVTGYGSKGYTWNYKNLMTAAGASGATSTYTYGPNNERVSKTVGGVTTKFPNNLYESSTATTTKHIYANGYLIGSVYGTGTTTASTTYAYPDHLDSTHLVINAEGDTIQTLEYTPWGAQESNTSLTANQQSNRYIGQEYDQESELSYLQNRMYNGANGKFLSQDPVFWGVQNLANPQSMNSYSYANNNPITYSDPTGLAVKEYQPYYPSNGSSYQSGETIGTYRTTNVVSRGPNTSAYNASYEQQCVAFANGFANNDFSGASVKGNANNLTFSTGSGDTGMFSSYDNGGSMMPQENDIMTWSGGTYGHVGVIAEVQFDDETGQGTVYTVEQNYGRSEGLFSQSLTRNEDGTYSVGSRSDIQVTGWTRYSENMNKVPTYTQEKMTPAPKAPINKKP